MTEEEKDEAYERAYNYDPSEEVTVVNIDNFTAEEIDKWLIIEMDDNEKAAKPKDAGSVDKRRDIL